MRAMWILAITILCCVMEGEARGWHRGPWRMSHSFEDQDGQGKKALFHSFEEKAKSRMEKRQRRLCNNMGHLGGIFGDTCKVRYADESSDDQSNTFSHKKRTSRNDFRTQLKTERETVIDLTIKLKSEQDRADQLAQELEKERANRRLKQQQLWSLKREAQKESLENQGPKFELEAKLLEQQRVESNLLSKLAAAKNRYGELSKIVLQLEQQVQHYKDGTKQLEQQVKHYNANAEHAEQELLTTQARCCDIEDQMHRCNASLRLQPHCEVPSQSTSRMGQKKPRGKTLSEKVTDLTMGQKNKPGKDSEWPHCGPLPKLASQLKKQGVHFNEKCELEARPHKEHTLMFLLRCVLLIGMLKGALYVATMNTNAKWIKPVLKKLAQLTQLLAAKDAQLSAMAGQNKPEQPRETQSDNTENSASCGVVEPPDAMATTSCNIPQDRLWPEDLPILEEVKEHDARQDSPLDAQDSQNLAVGFETKDSPEDLPILEEVKEHDARQDSPLDAQDMQDHVPPFGEGSDSLRNIDTSDTPSSGCASASSEFKITETYPPRTAPDAPRSTDAEVTLHQEPDAPRSTDESDTSSSCSEFEIIEACPSWTEEPGTGTRMSHAF